MPLNNVSNTLLNKSSTWWLQLLHIMIIQAHEPMAKRRALLVTKIPWYQLLWVVQRWKKFDISSTRNTTRVRAWYVRAVSMCTLWQWASWDVLKHKPAPALLRHLAETWICRIEARDKRAPLSTPSTWKEVHRVQVLSTCPHARCTSGTTRSTI